MSFPRTLLAPSLSVVVPAFNEAAVIEHTAEALASWMARKRGVSEILLVDDGSTDETPRLMERICARIPSARRIGWRRNRGRGAALRAGLLAARGSVVLATEADLSWDTDTLEALCRAIEDDRADLALASPHRFPGGFENVPAPRRLLSRAANAVAGKLLGHSITMATGMTRAYRREILPRIVSERNDKAFHLDSLCRAIRAGLRVLEIPAIVRWPTGRGGPHHGARLADLGIQVLAHLAVLGDHLWQSHG
jgi:glycosyltransferase involved in cell wall biosynthesis